jgi:hypothetical protein
MKRPAKAKIAKAVTALRRQAVTALFHAEENDKRPEDQFTAWRRKMAKKSRDRAAELELVAAWLEAQ